METRRSFIKKSVYTASLAALPISASCINIDTVASDRPLKSGRVKSAAVLWYSQSGNTQIYGKALGQAFEREGVKTFISDLRDMDPHEAAQADLIVVGSPVFYYDAPEYALGFLKQLPDLQGKPVAAFVTFGGPEGNQHNAACSILKSLVAKNGVPVGLETFLAAKTYPLSYDKYEKALKENRSVFYPDDATFSRISTFADQLLTDVKNKRAAVFKKQLTLREFSTWFNPVWWTKRSIDRHQIIEDKCEGCGACVEKCPADAIALDTHSVDTDACVLCFGCINTCRNQAVLMESGGERLIGFYDFMKKNNLKIKEEM